MASRTRRAATGSLLAALVLLLAAVEPVPAAAAGTGHVPGSYIVVYNDGVGEPGAATARRERAGGFRARFRYHEAIKGFAARLSKRQVEELRSDPAVASVSVDRTVRASGVVPLAAGDSAPTGVRRIESATPTTAREPSIANIAVIDTGIDLDHPDLDAVDGRDCVQAGTPADDDDGHGTHVAGTIAAENDGAGVVGVAPGTRVVAVKVLDATGSGTDAEVICGIDWVTATRTDGDPSNDIAVANMSLGGVGLPVQSCATTTDPLHIAVCDSTAAGITYVVAAGNEAWDFDYPPQPDTPAAYPEVLTVTAMADSDGRPGALGGSPACDPGSPDDHAASFSSFAATSAGADHTIAAPGVCIRSTAIGGGYETMSGTSMAAPHVAGAVALCLGEGDTPGPCADLTPAQIVERMRSQAERHSARLPGYGFAGDPSRPLSTDYFGYLTAALDTDPPALSLTQPADGSTTSDSTLRLAGAAGSAAGDAATVTVQIFQGAGTSTSAVRTLHATRSSGSWSLDVPDAAALADGTYTALASQDDDVGNTGRSAPATFTVSPPPPEQPAPAPEPPPASAPAPAPTAAPAEQTTHPAKLSVSRSNVDRRQRRLDVLAPITRRASGKVKVAFTAAGRTYRFTERIDSEHGYVRFNRRIPRAQAALGTGILTIAYPGDGDTRPQRVRLRAASRKAHLDVRRPRLADGRLRTRGTISRRARGVVRIQIDYVSGGREHAAEYEARIRRGRWSLDEALAADVRQAIATRHGTVHSYTLFTGYLPKRMRGEMRAYQVLRER